MCKVISVSKSSIHEFSKDPLESIKLIAGEGVEGDAHCGKTVQHRSRVKKDPTQPNLRQIHLIHDELIQSLRSQGFNVHAASLGENITTSGVGLLGLPKDTILKIGDEVEIQITGLRNPCGQLDGFQKGLKSAVLDTDEKGNLIRKAGGMGIILKGGIVKIGDKISVVFPSEPHCSLEPV
jgi:MOSC domain-containing protein YiiM